MKKLHFSLYIKTSSQQRLLGPSPFLDGKERALLFSTQALRAIGLEPQHVSFRGRERAEKPIDLSLDCLQQGDSNPKMGSPQYIWV
jgi:hypothetical protein